MRDEPGPEPIVSVVIPTFDRLSLLREAVDSVIAQTFPAWELLVVDDGSTDGTKEWLSGHPEARLCALFLPHCGSPAAVRNVGIRSARGRWVAFLDSDDLWAHDKLERQVEALTAAPCARWSVTGFEMIDLAGTRSRPRHGSARAIASGWALDAMLERKGTAAIQTLVAERALLYEAGLFDEGFLRASREDFDLILKIAELAPVAAVAEPLAFIREHAGRSAAQERSLLRDVKRVFEGARERAVDGRRRRLVNAAFARAAGHVAASAGRSGRRAEALEALACAWRASALEPFVWALSLRIAWGGGARCNGRR